MTLDGVGEYDTVTVSSAGPDGIRKLSSTRFPDSLGLFYSALTAYLGFEVNEGEYKVMGMAAFGAPRFSDQIRNQVKIPTMTVGKITSYGDINAILAAGRADLCLLAKGHLRNPYFTRDAAEAQGYDLQWPRSYKSAKEFSLRNEN